MNIKAYTGNDPYIFISYCHKNSEVYDVILKELSSNGFRFWYDEGIQSGRAWADEISMRIKNCSQFLVFLSKEAINSENVKDEIHLALKNKKDMQIIHLEEIELDGGLELQLDRKQAILRYKYSNEHSFYDHLFKSLSTLTKEETSVSNTLLDLKEQYEITETFYKTNFVKLHYGFKKNTGIPVFIKQYCTPDSVHGFTMSKRRTTEEEMLIALQSENSPHTVTLYDIFKDKTNTFIVTSRLNGITLDKKFESFDYSDTKAIESVCVEIALNIARALKYFHNAKNPIAHRDIKPSNIIISQHGDVFIIDLNCCLCYKNVTNLDAIDYVGTLAYAAPECFCGVGLIPDNRADIYSLGITLLQILTGKDPNNIRVPIFNCFPLRYFNSDFDPILEQIINKMIASNRDERYQNIDSVINDLNNYKSHSYKAYLKALLKSNKRIRECVKNNKTKTANKKSHKNYKNESSVSLILRNNETTIIAAETEILSNEFTTILSSKLR